MDTEELEGRSEPNGPDVVQPWKAEQQTGRHLTRQMVQRHNRHDRV